MARPQQAFDPGLYTLRLGLRVVGYINFHQAFAVEQLQHADSRQKHGVIEIETQHLALGSHHADHAVALATDTDQCPQRTSRCK